MAKRMIPQTTDIVSSNLGAMIKANGSKFFGVTFIKKDGTERTLNGHVRPVKGHDGQNTVAHLDKYVTIVLNEKDENGDEQWRNVNLETITHLHIGGRKLAVTK